MGRNRFEASPAVVRMLPWLLDGGIVLVALACIFVGARPLVTSAATARPELSSVLSDVTLPQPAGTPDPSSPVRLSAEERRMSAGETLAPIARDLEATVGRYREVEDLRAAGRLRCDQLRESYRDVESAWIRYSVARRRAYGGSIPASLETWDAELYEAVRKVDRGFASSGCRRP